MHLSVVLTEGAAGDLEEIIDYVELQRSRGAARRLLDRIERALENLAEFPDRGKPPRELAGLGLDSFREILVPPYRLIYRVIEPTVNIYLIADGRRDFQSLLTRRLLRG